MDEEKILEDCGLTQVESKIYLELLKQGQSTAYKIAKEAGVHKSNGYDALKSLSDKGLVSFHTQDKHSIYQTTDPANILNLLKLKQEHFSSILPKLKLMEGMVCEKSEATIHKGVPAFLNLLFGLLEYNKPINVYGIPKAASDLVADYVEDFHKERIKKKITMNHIYNFCSQERINYIKKKPYTTARSLPKSVESTASTTICGPEVQIQVWFEGKVKIIRIVDKEIAKSYQSYFDFMWKMAK